MPSVTDLQQQSSKISSDNNGKSTPPPPQQQQMSSTPTGVNSGQLLTDNADPITQAILMLEKKQRNLGKRKEKLESYEQEAKSGKELIKDQKDALAKYGEVIGQIECAKDVYEQLKKIQAEAAKNQKRLSKQAAEEKRVLTAQRIREYAQLRYLLDHRPSSLKAEESSLLDELARVVIPSDFSTNIISRCVDTVLSIYQGGSLSSTIKHLTGRNSQEVRETIEQLIKQFESSTSLNDMSTPQQIQSNETIKQTPIVPTAPPSTPAPVMPQREQSHKTNDVIVSSTSVQQALSQPIHSNSNEYPIQFDTRDQNIPLEQIIDNSLFFSHDINPTNNNQQVLQDTSTNQDNNRNQSSDQKQYLYNNLNSNITSQVPSQTYMQTPSASSQQQQQGATSYDQESSSNLANSNNVPDEEQQTEEQWHQPRGNSGNAQRGGQINGNGNRNYNRGAHQNYNQQQWRGSRGGGGQYDGSYGGGQRQYNENNYRGGGGQRGGPNPNYRGNRGGGYRGGNRGAGAGYNGNGDGYQKSGQYQQNNEQQQQQQQQQVRSAPSNQQQ